MFPKEFLETAWRNSGEKTWPEFREGLERSRDEAPHESLVDALQEVAEDLDKDGWDFPPTSDELFSLLKDHVEPVQPLSERGRGEMLANNEYARVIVEMEGPKEIKEDADTRPAQ